MPILISSFTNNVVPVSKQQQKNYLSNFIHENDELQAVELLISDLNGILRGKWAPKDALQKIVEPGINLPMSIFGLDIWGREVDETELHIDSGDLDGFCQLIDQRIANVNWAKRPTAQALLTMADEKGKPFFGDPRNALKALVTKMARLGLKPVVAFELEFYLVDPDSFQTTGKITRDRDSAHGAHGPAPQDMYSLSALRGQNELFADVRAAAIEQGLPIDTIIKEAAPGQFEVNLQHRDDAMAAADDAVLLRRIITECAHNYGLKATFMAKPFLDWPGNGMHVHTSILDKQGKNIFAEKSGKQNLEYAAAGLLNTLEDSLLLFVPSFNGYRRLQPGSYAPTRIAWGYNNRSVAVRVPASNENATRLEHRISGADANPYLVLIGVLGGILEGLDNKKTPPKPIKGNAYNQKLPNLSDDMGDAIDEFANSKFIAKLLGKKLQKIITAVKRKELEAFLNEITPLERSTYL